MAQKRTPMAPEQMAKALAELRRDVAKRTLGYRAKALRILPHICASCAREFSGPRLKELTVHHKDHDHNNNPPDGSNWELLCLYCHDHEHEKLLDARYINSGGSPTLTRENSGFANPFENLCPKTDPATPMLPSIPKRDSAIL